MVDSRERGATIFPDSLSPIKNEEGSIEEVVGVGRDITDLKEAEEFYQKLLDGIPILPPYQSRAAHSGSKQGHRIFCRIKVGGYMLAFFPWDRYPLCISKVRV